MVLGLRWQLQIPVVPWLQPGKAARIAEDVFLPAVEESGLFAQREVVTRTPVGATAILRGSIQQATEVMRGTPVQFRSTVATAQAYARPVEDGTRPHWAPIGPLKLWAKRILGDERLAYAVQATIAKRGTKGQHSWRDGVAAATPRIRAILARARSVYAQRLRGGR